VNGYRDLPKEADVCQENTEKLREFEENISVRMPENNKENQVKIDQTKEKTQEGQKIAEKEKEKNTKKVEGEEKKTNNNAPDEIASHYKNLNQALNDFFSSEEGEEESENDEHETKK